MKIAVFYSSPEDGSKPSMLVPRRYHEIGNEHTRKLGYHRSKIIKLGQDHLLNDLFEQIGQSVHGKSRLLQREEEPFGFFRIQSVEWWPHR